MPSLYNILMQLQQQAQPRPDIGGGKPYTFAGRVGNAAGPQPSSVAEMLMRPPQESPDAEGMGTAMMTAAGMGIPLASKMKIPAGTNLNNVLEQMYQNHIKATRTVGIPDMSRDIWIKSKINDLALTP